MKLIKQIVVLGVVALNMSGCGIFGSKDGGSSGGPGNKPTPGNTPAPKTEEQSSSVPPSVRTLDELLKDIGADSFIAEQVSDEALYTRVKEVEDLAAYGSLNRVIGDAYVHTDNKGIPTSCEPKSMDPMRLVGKSLAFGEVSFKFKPDFKGDFKKSDLPSLAVVPKFATVALSKNWTWGEDEKHIDEIYVGITGDQIVQASVQSEYKKDKLVGLLNCARIYTKSTHSVKTSCSDSMVVVSGTSQSSFFSEESYLENQYSIKDSYTTINLDTKENLFNQVLSYKQLSADTVAFDIRKSSKIQPENNITGTMKITTDGGSQRTCEILSGAKDF